jgi:hypothetical protein
MNKKNKSMNLNVTNSRLDSSLITANLKNYSKKFTIFYKYIKILSQT